MVSDYSNLLFLHQSDGSQFSLVGQPLNGSNNHTWSRARTGLASSMDPLQSLLKITLHMVLGFATITLSYPWFKIQFPKKSSLASCFPIQLMVFGKISRIDFRRRMNPVPYLSITQRAYEYFTRFKPLSVSILQSSISFGKNCLLINLYVMFQLKLQLWRSYPSWWVLMVHFLIFMDKFYCWNPCLLLIRCFLWLFKKRNKGKLGVSLVPASVQNKMVFVAKSGNFDYPAFETSNSSRNSFMLHQVTSTSIRRRKIAVILFLNGLHFVHDTVGLVICQIKSSIWSIINVFIA